ncbi:unnamed protein product [Protopolystoma xenopodis]|uniref:Uncharacterized protein n=1 Tax=Protopolystoma xenopodis TaxID=117903 RepID=A0A448WSW7_9PLAT|nr:unnamed protein product [Protopolystoma xenopodis]
MIDQLLFIHAGQPIAPTPLPGLPLGTHLTIADIGIGRSISCSANVTIDSTDISNTAVLCSPAVRPLCVHASGFCCEPRLIHQHNYQHNRSSSIYQKNCIIRRMHPSICPQAVSHQPVQRDSTHPIYSNTAPLLPLPLSSNLALNKTNLQTNLPNQTSLGLQFIPERKQFTRKMIHALDASQKSKCSRRRQRLSEEDIEQSFRETISSTTATSSPSVSAASIESTTLVSESVNQVSCGNPYAIYAVCGADGEDDYHDEAVFACHSAANIVPFLKTHQTPTLRMETNGFENLDKKRLGQADAPSLEASHSLGPTQYCLASERRLVSTRLLKQHRYEWQFDLF